MVWELPEGPSLAEGTPVLLLPTGTLNGERVNDPFCLQRLIEEAEGEKSGRM